MCVSEKESIIPHLYLAHLRLAFSSQEAQIVDLILNHKVLLLTLKVLHYEDREQKDELGNKPSRPISNAIL